jgi:hypothetical protein
MNFLTKLFLLLAKTRKYVLDTPYIAQIPTNDSATVAVLGEIKFQIPCMLSYGYCKVCCCMYMTFSYLKVQLFEEQHCFEFAHLCISIWWREEESWIPEAGLADEAIVTLPAPCLRQ